MDKALRLVHGSFIAAAKLLDMEPQRFRNLVNYHPCLAQWRQRRRGRPSLEIGFQIRTRDESAATIPISVELLKHVWKGLTVTERLQFQEWVALQTSLADGLAK